MAMRKLSLVSSLALSLLFIPACDEGDDEIIVDRDADLIPDDEDPDDDNDGVSDEEEAAEAEAEEAGTETA